MSKPVMRPRDAATLILIRRSAGRPEVLMGKRHAGHTFMPNRYVFPGGRVDASDHRIPIASDLKPAVLASLTRRASPARARALAIAAVRETYEETGLLIGRPTADAVRLKGAAWEDFRARGLAPALDVFDYVFRAVTPPGRTRRFNARFFLAEPGVALHGTLGGNGELGDLAWLSLEAALALPVPDITRRVLSEVRLLLAEPPSPEVGRPVPVYTQRSGKYILHHE